MSISYIPETVKLRLWGKAGGRCQYEGCNEPLWLDSLTKAQYNKAYIAHIIADQPKGPRGDKILSKKLAKNIENLMLMCDQHHRLIDKHNIKGHPVERLHWMKKRHEDRIAVLGAIKPEKASHILLYGANTGAHISIPTFDEAALAMVPYSYPAEATPIILGFQNSATTDKTKLYWEIEATQLQSKYLTQVKSRLESNEIKNLSIFARAPQPLLMLLGTLVGDITKSIVYQPHREPATWVWQKGPKVFDYKIIEPKQKRGTPALVFSLSGYVDHDKIKTVLGKNVDFWEVTISNPSNDFLRSREQAQMFRTSMRGLCNKINKVYGTRKILHIFPAMPAALAVEFGRIRMPKAEMPLVIYDHIDAKTGFVKAVEIKREN